MRKVMNEEGGDCDEEEGRSGRSRSGPGRDARASVAITYHSRNDGYHINTITTLRPERTQLAPVYSSDWTSSVNFF